jgi:hypothetical protein
VSCGISLAALAFVTIGAACMLEPVDDGAAAGQKPQNTADLTNWQLCQSPSCDSIDGSIPFMTQTPIIYLPDGATTSSPCVEVELESMRIRQTYCVSCHGVVPVPPAFAGILDDQTLVSLTSQTATLDSGAPQRLLIVGDPSDSRLYQMVAEGLMPPASTNGTSVPRPSVADLSVLYGWILACADGADGGGYVFGGGDYGPDAGAAEGDAGIDSGVVESGNDSAVGMPEPSSTDSAVPSGPDDASVEFGKACTSNANCASSYPSCQMIQGSDICTKTCTTNADCPDPPTSGVCNSDGYCK